MAHGKMLKLSGKETVGTRILKLSLTGLFLVGKLGSIYMKMVKVFKRLKIFPLF